MSGLKLTNRSTTGGSTIAVPVIETNGAESTTRLDSLAIEEPLEIRIGETSVSVTMRTPGHDAELAAGFLFGEGLLRSRDHVESIEVGGSGSEAETNVVSVRLRNEVAFELDRLERHFYTTSSCGVCGKASIEALEMFPADEMNDDLVIEPGVLRDLPKKLLSNQEVFHDTGGLHAAGLFDADGALLDIREDVGRHNALDKLIGAQILDGTISLRDKIVLVSGRASFELVQKTVMAQIPILAAVGAVSSLAAELASAYGLTLIGFVRDGRFNVYTRPARVATDVREEWLARKERRRGTSEKS